jgi:hypothetical protein
MAQRTGRLAVAASPESLSTRLMHHLRYAGLSFAAQSVVLERILRADTVVWPAIERARDLGLPDWMVVSGALYNTVWNHLTGKPPGHGIKDIDLFYHDASDLSWQGGGRRDQTRRGAFCRYPRARRDPQSGASASLVQAALRRRCAGIPVVGPFAGIFRQPDPCRWRATRQRRPVDGRRAVRARSYLFISHGAEPNHRQQPNPHGEGRPAPRRSGRNWWWRHGKAALYPPPCGEGRS